MDALYQTAGQVRSDVARAHRLMWTALLLLIAFIGACTIPTDYTTPRIVEGTVVAKTTGSVNTESGATLVFMVAVRYPNGTVKDIKTDLTHYSQAEVGSGWNVSVTDASLGHEMPLQNKLKIALVALLGLGCLISLVKLLRMF